MAWGERILAAAIGLFGLVWIVQASKLSYWGEFAPGSGFLPLWLGIALVALVVIFLVQSFRAAPAGAIQADRSAEAEQIAGQEAFLL